MGQMHVFHKKCEIVKMEQKKVVKNEEEVHFHIGRKPERKKDAKKGAAALYGGSSCGFRNVTDEKRKCEFVKNIQNQLSVYRSVER